ncbi:MAG: arylsulfatase [Verrucomicrobiota bacterium JB023]|nr:arylsulfatase [Verrucomicrobiota bacterium JB023]
MKRRHTLSILFSSIALGLGLHAESPSETRPNVLVILADDMGYGDVQALNPESKIPTPHLDSLAREGASFTDAHSPSSVCTPTRYGLLTGRYAWRSWLKKSVLFTPDKDKPLIENDRPTIASFLKKAGYSTHLVGKWHLGFEWPRKDNGEIDPESPITDGPIQKGFDTYFGVAASLDMVPYTFFRQDRSTTPVQEVQPALDFPKYVRQGPKAESFNFGDVLDILAAESDQVIGEAAKSEAPFFLYLPLTSPHKPVWPHERFVGKTDLGPYGDFVHQTDYTVGLVLESLKKHQVADNTLVIYTSDNGSFMFRIADRHPADHTTDATIQKYFAKNHRANAHWRGTKADIYEGGHRVPFFVRLPGRVNPGITVERTTSQTDIFATIADLLDLPLPEQAEDSYSFLKELSGKEGDKRPAVINHSINGTFAIRDGDWKLILANGSGGRQNPRGEPFGKPYQLYHLGDDPSESKNLIEEKPDLAARMEAKFQEIARDHETSR